MPVFIVSSLTLSLLVQNDSTMLEYLQASGVIAVGLLAAATGLLGAALKKLPAPLWCDVFATGALFVWFAYWRAIFNTDAPMFYFYPLYFTLLAAALALLLINRAERFDAESVQQLRMLLRITRVGTADMAVFVLVSIVITRHYTLFPIAMTLYIVDYAMRRSLELAEG